MTTTPLKALQLEAAEMLASGVSAAQVQKELALSVTTFENWRLDPLFVGEVARLKAARETTASETADESETDGLETELGRQFAR